MIYIVRHGQTEKNQANVLQGRSNAPLNAAGQQQAKALQEKLAAAGVRFDKVFTSPLLRAVQTASILAPGVPCRMDERLIEMDYGPYEGMGFTDFPPEVLYFFKDFVHHPAPAGMEPLTEVVKRLGAFLEEIREEAKGANVLVSTHAIAMKGALEYLTPESEGSYWSKYIGNCAVYTAEVLETGGFTIPQEWKD